MHVAPPRTVWISPGCNECANLGYFGRTGVFEFWQLDGVDYEMILSHASEHDIREQLAKRQHESLLTDGVSKARLGITSLSELRKMLGGHFPAEPKS
jgi:type II secretory ATPase GspE/PulE/Tfp pilus assembly ATPase PilB-like protein